MKALWASICLLVFVTACAAAEQAPRPSSADKLYEALSAGRTPVLAVIDSRSRTTDRRLALGAPSSDWRHLYSIAADSLVDTNPDTGAVQGSMQLGGSYRLPAATANGVPGGLSPNGGWLVVERFDQEAGSTPKATHMLVINTAGLTITRRVDLPGDFEFDAINDLATNLYLIQHLNGREYYVRVYDVASGVLNDEIVVDKSDGNQAMAGLRLSGVATNGGHWLLSMYVRQHQAPFIHALSLDGPYAFCLDLPGSGYIDDPAEMRWSLAPRPDGSLVYAVNPATGVVAAVTTGDNGAPAITRTERFQPRAGTATGGANTSLVSGHMLVAGGPSGLVWINTSNLKADATSLDGWRVASIGISPDGKNLYVLNEAGRIAIVSMGSRSVTGMFDPSAGRPMALMRVAAV
jgi:hypothetical protein